MQAGKGREADPGLMLDNELLSSELFLLSLSVAHCKIAPYLSHFSLISLVCPLSTDITSFTFPQTGERKLVQKESRLLSAEKRFV